MINSSLSSKLWKESIVTIPHAGNNVNNSTTNNNGTIMNSIKISSTNQDDHQPSKDQILDFQVESQLEEFYEKNLQTSPIQKLLFDPLQRHHDIMLIGRSIGYDLMAFYVLDYILSAKDRISKHDKKLNANRSLEFRDQGFTRPRALIILSFRNQAYELVDRMNKIFKSFDGKIGNKKRFFQEFGVPSNKDETEDDNENDNQKKSKESINDNDKEEIFHGNMDDCFRLGIRVNKKSLKLLVNFYSSDIVIASPLGLRLIIDGESVEANSSSNSLQGKNINKININNKKRARLQQQNKNRKGDHDFLSSIEVCIIDKCDVILMQNWEHLKYIFEGGYLNTIPKKTNGCDFSRLSSIFMDNLGSSVRQNIISSKFLFPELNQFFRNILGKNCLGQCIIEPESYPPAIMERSIISKIKFYNIGDCKVENQHSIRIQFLMDKVLSMFSSEDHICLFVPSYFDYVQIKYKFKKETFHMYKTMCEYDSEGSVKRAKTAFRKGDARILLVTERFYFFKRSRVKGIKVLIFYSIPENVDHVEKWIKVMAEGHENNNIIVLYSFLDYLKLERLVGTRNLIKFK